MSYEPLIDVDTVVKKLFKGFVPLLSRSGILFVSMTSLRGYVMLHTQNEELVRRLVRLITLINVNFQIN